MAEEKKVFAGMGKRVNDWKRGISICNGILEITKKGMTNV